jgi:hypothetical protein
MFPLPTVFARLRRRVPRLSGVTRAAGRVVVVLLLGSMAGCGDRAPRRAAPDFSRDLANGRQHAERLAEKQRSGVSAMSDADVVAAGYLERLRLGVGSPFRLMEYALLDPRLTAGDRGPLVWALLDATRAGRGYELDSRALVRMGTDAPSRDTAVAQRHLALIEHAVQSADDPRTGELAVREAYRLAAVSRTVSRGAPALAASAAALARDRELARRDAHRLLSASAASGRHPFAVMIEWRRQRRLEVEAPPGAPRAIAVEDAAVGAAVRLVERVEAVRASPAPAVAREDALPRLSTAAARRLAKLARTQSYPPQAPVWVTVQRYDEELRRNEPRDDRERSVGHLLEHARTEEALVAEHAALGTAAAPVREITALIAIDASVAMRAYAQERVWFPGFLAPTDVDLKRAFGLRAVEFDADVPGPWRPYYRRMLGDALADLEVVLPGLDLQGAAFRIGATGKGGAALAIHDPHGRTIHLPPESGAGAIAHEVGHDLDWQVAHARYRTRAAYGTEYALRAQRGDDRFATAVRRMPVPPELPMRGGPEVRRRYAQRPPEIFARTFDGYVAAALAERGRSNGYLSAAQDEFLGGHGLALAPGAREDAEPFMEMMMVVSPVPEPARREFLARWGADRVPGASEVASRIVAPADAGAPPAPAARPEPGMVELLAAGERVRAEAAAVMALRDSALAQWNAARCANPFPAHGPRGEAAVRRLADAAASARIRGIVLTRARALGMDAAPSWLRDAWLDGLQQEHGLADLRGRTPFRIRRQAHVCGESG